MGTVFEFPKKQSQQEASENLMTQVLFHVEPEVLLEEWISRNKVISDEFHKYNAYEKQGILDTVLDMSNDLYALVLELKEKLK
jgi:hypothetical protein